MEMDIFAEPTYKCRISYGVSLQIMHTTLYLLDTETGLSLAIKLQILSIWNFRIHRGKMLNLQTAKQQPYKWTVRCSSMYAMAQWLFKSVSALYSDQLLMCYSALRSLTTSSTASFPPIEESYSGLPFLSVFWFYSMPPSHPTKLSKPWTRPLATRTSPKLKSKKCQLQPALHVKPCYSFKLIVWWWLWHQPLVFRPSSPGYLKKLFDWRPPSVAWWMP